MESFFVPLISSGLFIEKKNISRASDMPEMHSHNCHELYFLLSGKRRYFVGHNIYDVSPGNIVIIPKSELHKTSVLEDEGYDRFVLYFGDDVLEELTRIIGETEADKFLSSGCLTLPQGIAEKIENNLEELLRENNNSDKISERLKLNLFLNTVFYLVRYGKRKATARNETVDKIGEVARFISENYSSDITLSDCAKKAFMEESYFSKKFHSITGFGFKEYLIGIRINRAENMLLETDKPISIIADECGFGSSNYFGDIFKKVKGLSPSEYRKVCAK